MATEKIGSYISHAQKKVHFYLLGVDNLLKISTLKVAVQEVHITK